MMRKYVIVNSFSSERFTGNPVAVFFDCDDLNDNCMQQIAAELKLSETTFIRKASRDGDVNVKIFTPVNELAFAGHPLLGTALALANITNRFSIKIETLKGTFQFLIEPKKKFPFTANIQMEQPNPDITPYTHQRALLEALGLAESTLPIDMYDVGPRHVFVGVKNTAALSSIRPDYKKLAEFPNMAALCFSPDENANWRLRMFSPAYGVTEDAATGSAAGPMALHLARYGLIQFGQRIHITQGVEMLRPSRMNAIANRQNEKFNLHAGGDAFQVASGEYFI
jgi:trans-2,3-dihydro-3-hydroxyanthranilate isomerase